MVAVGAKSTAAGGKRCHVLGQVLFNIIEFCAVRELFFFTFTTFFQNAVTLKQKQKQQKTIQI